MSRNTADLPVPDFFDRRSVCELRPITYERIMEEGLLTARKVRPAAEDGRKIALVPIDAQLSFCRPGAALFVSGRSGTGAVDDTRRTAEFIYRHTGLITRIIPTMDTHRAWQIFHPLMWTDGAGRHPLPGTVISLDDLQAGRWQVNPAAAYALLGDGGKYSYLREYGLHYVQTLTEGGKYPLMIWPYHAMLGDPDHALAPGLQEACFYHSVARGVQTDYRIKGDNPLTEHYSPLRPEVLEDQAGRPIASANKALYDALLQYDMIIVCGQAKSHCLAWFIDDLLLEIKARSAALARKVYLVEDLTSPVVMPSFDFSEAADRAFRRYAEAGMHVVTSTVPLEDWPV